MKIAICDDNLQDAEGLRDILTRTEGNDVIDLFRTGEEFLSAVRERKYDLVFMDIYLRDEDGITVVREMRKISPATDVVFATISDSHALAAFSVNAIHYLVKPYTEEDILEALRRARAPKALDRTESSLTISIGRDIYNLLQRDIIRVESDNHKTNIYMKNGSVYSTRMQFGKVEEELDRHFMTINRGLAINMRYVTKWGTQEVVLSDGRTCLVSRRNRQRLKEIYYFYKIDEMVASKRK